ncbi:MAG: hypothetical protein RL745_352 [Actinomycetota bacterium]|jgi:4-diphosphocytidyl-2-C-methyl-D-erythritol kinase
MTDATDMPRPAGSVVVRAPAKINLGLAIGPLRDDGFHDLATVFHAVDIYDTVTVSACLPSERGVSVRMDGVSGEVPADATNLAWQAAQSVAARIGREPDVRISIDKRIPVAAGMAGGSADAAATLVACSCLWDAELDNDQLVELAAGLGSDVAFALYGGSMLGRGRGEQLSPVLGRANLRWVIAVSDEGLSTHRVYQRLDELRADDVVAQLRSDACAQVLTALAGGEVDAIGAALTNDLQAAAIALRPSLSRTLDVGMSAGAVGGVVSGSGPTCCFLAPDDETAVDISVALMSEAACDRVMQARGPVPGALANIRVAR